MLLHRPILDLINEYLSLFPCLLLLGPRQVGKTTLLSQLGSDWQRFDLEKRADFDHIANDPDLFLRTNNRRVIIDEAQLLPALFPALRVAIDQDRSFVGRFVLTGSSSPALLRSVSESLAGRAAPLEIGPFSFHEATSVAVQFAKLVTDGVDLPDFPAHLSYKSTIQKTHEYWLKGGYPEPWVKNKERFHALWMDQYVRSYLERDLGHLFPGIDDTRFRLFFRHWRAYPATL